MKTDRNFKTLLHWRKEGLGRKLIKNTAFSLSDIYFCGSSWSPAPPIQQSAAISDVLLPNLTTVCHFNLKRMLLPRKTELVRGRKKPRKSLLITVMSIWRLTGSIKNLSFFLTVE